MFLFIISDYEDKLYLNIKYGRTVKISGDLVLSKIFMKTFDFFQKILDIGYRATTELLDQ